MPEQFETGCALLIGVDENRIPNLALPTVANDVTALYRVLTHPKRCAYLETNVQVLLGQDASRQSILNGIAWLRGGSRPSGVPPL